MTSYISKIILPLIFTLLIKVGYAQELLPTNYWFTDSEAKSVSLDFTLVNNTIRIPGLINGSKDTMFFIVDSGLKIPLIMNLGEHKLKDVKYARDMVIKGLGRKDSLIVKTSYENFFRIPGLININEYINVVQKDIPFLSTTSGQEVNGLVGYSLLKGFVVEINYYKGNLTFYHPERYKKKKWWFRRSVTLPLEIYKSKPYVTIKVQNNEGRMVDAKLLLDTGYSQALWLDENVEKNIVCPEKNIECLMGRGLSGDIIGRVSYTPKVKLGKIEMKNVLTAYPDTLQYDKHQVDSLRMGSIGGEFLRRFRVILNYKEKEVTFVRNPDFRNKYKINKTGMVIEKPMLKYPVYVVTRIIKDSAADKCGIEPGDIVVSIEDKMITELSVKEVLSFLNTTKKKLSLVLNRDDKRINIELNLPGNLKK